MRKHWGGKTIFDERVYEIIANLENAEAPIQNPKIIPSGFKLPKLNLLTFNGDITQWVEFWEIFECSIHNNNTLSTKPCSGREASFFFFN